MLKLLLPAILFVLLTLAACGDQAPTDSISPTSTAHPEATTPANSQPALTQPAEPTSEPDDQATPKPSGSPTSTPEPSATAAIGRTPISEPAETVPPPRLTPVPTPTQMPTATRAPIATAIPTPEPNPTPKPTPTPTATPRPTQPPSQTTSMWRGITVAPENRCSPYDSEEYRYSPSVEPRIVNALGGIYGPYTGTWFESIKETDIEHIVARSEAHDSGLCAAGPATWSEFASDLLNLTLASPSVNRHQKSDNDAAEWLPELNQCWYVDRTIQVRLEYGLTIDRAEAEAIDRVLATCESTEMVVLADRGSTTAEATATPTPTPTAAPGPTPNADVDALALWDDNGNGRITCAEARAHGIAPVRRGHPAYEYMRDADGDGVVCE